MRYTETLLPLVESLHSIGDLNDGFLWRSIVRAGASRSLGGGSGARLGAIRLVASVSLGGGRGAGLAPSRSVASESIMLLPMIAFTSGA